MDTKSIMKWCTGNFRQMIRRKENENKKTGRKREEKRETRPKQARDIETRNEVEG